MEVIIRTRLLRLLSARKFKRNGYRPLHSWQDATPAISPDQTHNLPNRELLNQLANQLGKPGRTALQRWE